MPESQSSHLAVKTVDVSAAFDNCFFNTFALHRLSNKLDFPENLFAIHDNDSDDVRTLKTHFSSMYDLDLFEAYGNCTTSNKPSSPYLFEKTMILGILLRSWFVSELLTNEQNKEESFHSLGGESITFTNIVETVTTYADFYQELIGEEPIYLANKDFFDGKCAIKPTDGQDQLKQFWRESGYNNYCRYLAQPGVKISRDDVRPIFLSHNIPCIIYDKKTNVRLAEFHSNDNSPAYELALDVQEGHYFLLSKVESTYALLDQYNFEHQAYKEDRERVLNNSSANKAALCDAQPSLLLAGIIRPQHLGGQSALQLIVEKIGIMKAVVNLESVEVPSHVPPVSEALPGHESSSSVTEIPDEIPESDVFLSDNEGSFGSSSSSPDFSFAAANSAKSSVNRDEESAPKQPSNFADAEVPLPKVKRNVDLTKEETIFNNLLNDLYEKSLYFHGKKNKEKYQAAADESLRLYTALDGYFEAYLQSPKKKPDYDLFKEQSLTAINSSNEKGIFQHHRGAKEIVANLALAVLGLGVIYLVVGAIKYACTGNFLLFKPKTDTNHRVNKIKKAFDDSDSPALISPCA